MARYRIHRTLTALFSCFFLSAAGFAAIHEATCGQRIFIYNAIQRGNETGEPQVIRLNPRGFTEVHLGHQKYGLCTYRLPTPLGEGDGDNAFPSVQAHVTIEGNGSVIERIEGEDWPPFRLFHVAPGGHLTLKNVVLKGGRAEGDYSDPGTWRPFSGGAVFNAGTLELIDSTIVGNRAGINGGGIYNIGTLVVRDSAIVDNEAGTSGRGGGGGLAALGGEIEVRGSTIARNRGGGALTNNQGSMTIVNATISENSGAGITNIPNGGPYGPLTLANSIIAGNSGSDCVGEITSRGNNVIGDIGACPLSLSPTDIQGDPGLGRLDATELPGRPHYPPAADSPAIDRATVAACRPTDQLGRPRWGRCDIGAVEAPGVEMYVSPTGQDSNPGTLDTPFGTIQHAVDVAAAGDTIYLRGGVYREEHAAARVPQPTGVQIGTPAFPKRDLRILAHAGERPILKGSVVVDGWEPDGNLWRKDDWPSEPQLVFRTDDDTRDGELLEKVGWRSDWYFANPKYCPLGNAQNILAVEVHQASTRGDEDMLFALELFDGNSVGKCDDPEDRSGCIISRDAYWSYLAGQGEPETAPWGDSCTWSRYNQKIYESDWRQGPPAGRPDLKVGAYPPATPYLGWPRARGRFLHGYPKRDATDTLLGELPTTTYFRFILPPLFDPTAYSLVLRLWADDAAVVYLNGEELDLNGEAPGRLNLPEGDVTFETLATDPVDRLGEEQFIDVELSESDLNSARPVFAALASGAIQVGDDSAGAFFYDRQEKTLYLWLEDGSDPNQSVIEVSRMLRPFDSSPSRGIQVEGLTFRHSNLLHLESYNNVMVGLGADSVISGSDIGWSDHAGVSLRSRSQLVHSKIHHHPIHGIGGSGTGLLVRGNEVTHNGYLKGGGWDSGGMKFIPDAAGIVEDNEVAWNHDQAIWFDMCNSGEPIVIRRNYVHHNGSVEEWAGEGIFIEVSSNATIENNLLVDNAIVALNVTNSSNVRAFHNTIVNTSGYFDVKFIWAPRINPKTQDNWHFEGNRFSNNIIAANDQTVGSFLFHANDNAPEYISNNRSDCNLFVSPTRPLLSMGCSQRLKDQGVDCSARQFRDLAAWTRDTGWDEHSVNADPQFSAAGENPYLPGLRSPAVNEGCMDVPVETDIRGVARPHGLGFDIGAYEVLQRSRNDFDGDGKSDLVLFDAEQGLWHIRHSGSGEVVTERVPVSRPGRAVPADFDGDGSADPAVFDRFSGRWKIRHSATGEVVTSEFGRMGQGAPGDYDGDGVADLASYDRQRRRWSVLRSSDSRPEVLAFGGSGFRHVPGDFDGDGRMDPAAFDESRGLWRARLSGSGETIERSLNLRNQRVAARDFDGDGAAELAMIDRSTGVWKIFEADGSVSEPGWGSGPTYPVPGDYDGDGIEDLAECNEAGGEWRVRFSSTGEEWHHPWTVPGTRPLPVR